MHRTARVRKMGIVAVGLLLLLVALASAIGVSAQSLQQSSSTDDLSNTAANRDVTEGYRATLQALPPPPTPRPGYLGIYWPVISNTYLNATFPASPTAVPFAGVQAVPADQNASDRN